MTGVSGAHLDSTEHGLKQCSVRLERLPVELTAGSDLQSHGNNCEKQCSNWIAGHHQVLGDNIQYKNSPTLQRHLWVGMERFWRIIITILPVGSNCDSSNLHVHSEYTSEKLFNCNECDFILLSILILPT